MLIRGKGAGCSSFTCYVMQYCWSKKCLWRFAAVIKRINEVLTGFECNLDATIEKGLFLPHTQNIVIGQGVVIKERVPIYNGVSLGAVSVGNSGDELRYPRIGEGVIVYTCAKVLRAISIGHNANIGANSVVLRAVPDNFVAVGPPAKLVKRKI